MATRTFRHPDSNGPVGPPGERPLISSVRVEESPGHDYVHVWNRSGKSGVLTVTKGDGLLVAYRLFGGRMNCEEVT